MYGEDEGSRRERKRRWALMHDFLPHEQIQLGLCVAYLDVIKGVFRYRCKCGVNLQVLTETDRARIDEGIRLEITCPKCQEKQVIYAYRITKMTIELPAKNQN